jgi:hypothetical protein
MDAEEIYFDDIETNTPHTILVAGGFMRNASTVDPKLANLFGGWDLQPYPKSQPHPKPQSLLDNAMDHIPAESNDSEDYQNALLISNF